MNPHRLARPRKENIGLRASVSEIAIKESILNFGMRGVSQTLTAPRYASCISKRVNVKGQS